MGMLQLVGQGGLIPAADPFSSSLVTALPFNYQTEFRDQSHIVRGSGSPAAVFYQNIAYQPAATISPDNYKFANYGASLKKPIRIPLNTSFHASELEVNIGVANTIGTNSYCWEGWFYTEDFYFADSGQLTLLYSGNAPDSYGPSAVERDCPAILVGSDTYSIASLRRGIRLYQQPNNTGILDASSCLSPNTWHHIAVTRSGTTARIFVDGVLRATGTDSKSYTGYIQSHLASLNRTLLSGMYFQDIRFYVGTAKYTTNFTPPGAMFL
jgi:hypothetical protein